MSEFYRFFAKVVFFSLMITAFLAYPIWHFLGSVSLWSVLYGSMVGIFNILLAYGFNHRAIARSRSEMMKFMLVGMGIRLTIVAVATIIVAKLTNLPILEFITALLLYYLFLQWLEIRFIQKNILVSGKQK